MKTIILILLLPFFCKAQMDSTKAHVAQMQVTINKAYVQIEHMQYCIDNHHREWRNSILVSALGALITVGASAASDSKAKTALIIGGGALMTVGVIIRIDSFKWLQRAGEQVPDRRWVQWY